MTDKTKSDKPFFGWDKRNEEGDFLTYEIWENLHPDKIVSGQKKDYFSDILSNEQVETILPFWKKVGKEINDPILTLQYDKNGGATILYQYSDERVGKPANAYSRVIKPIMEKGVLKMIISDYSKCTYILHTSIKSPSFADDIIDFASIVEGGEMTDEKLGEKNGKEESFANTYVFDRRINK